MQRLRLVKDLEKIEETLREQIKPVFKKGDKIAVKLHMGETNNRFFIKADKIRIIVSVLKELGLNPFLFDSPAMYVGGRDTVEKYFKTAGLHGFNEKEIGCPIMISDESVDVKTRDLEVHVCREIAEADGLLVVSHVKGHSCAAFGGAIKNLGMGAVSKESKKDIHSGGSPLFVKECKGCGLCAKFCPTGCIEMKDGKAAISLDSCYGCSTCELNCPYDVLKPKLGIFDSLLAQGAQAVLKKAKKVFFVNFILDVSRLCDCRGADAGPIIVGDIGVVFGKDIVAIDKASVDLVNNQKMDIFKNIHHHDPYLQIKYAKELGLGGEEYDIS